MSNIYIQEPPTSGKVLLKTSVGDIDIELWSKECPLACRNFVQLCLEGYYNGTVFHRLVKGFIVQGGDPNGDGTGGESAYGHPFKDEFHSRLRYVRRGLVGMANSGRHDNASQFFFTLGPTPELQSQNTLFAKVAGDTVYNMLKLGEGEVYENERPHFPYHIIKTEVLHNPFPDIVPRKERQDASKQDAADGSGRKKKAKGVKNFGLLSFGDEAEEEEQEANEFVQKNVHSRGKSSHDVLDDPRLSKEVGEIATGGAQRTAEENAPSDGEGSADEQRKVAERNRKRVAIDDEARNVREKLKRKKELDQRDPSESDSDSDYGLDSERRRVNQVRAEQIREEINKLKKDYHADKRSKDNEKKVEQEKKSKKAVRSESMKEVLEVQEEYSQKTKQLPKKGSSRENFTLKLLERFKSKLHTAHEDTTDGERGETADEESDIQGDKWLSHRLEFERKDPVLAKDAATKDDDWYDVYDPRNPLNKRKRGAKVEKRGKAVK